jgi:hypothetical protein
MKIFQVTDNADQVEGRGPQVHVAAFTDKADADKLSKTLFSGRVNPLDVFDTYAEYLKSKGRKIRQSALDKLTDEERTELGV